MAKRTSNVPNRRGDEEENEADRHAKYEAPRTYSTASRQWREGEKRHSIGKVVDFLFLYQNMDQLLFCFFDWGQRLQGARLSYSCGWTSLRHAIKQLQCGASTGEKGVAVLQLQTYEAQSTKSHMAVDMLRYNCKMKLHAAHTPLFLQCLHVRVPKK
ncbi:hypothetical protein M431DRAFT_379789 [Trichoderma harzianum CBS 226.95]|uniref:Uncharacterized protein n=1 Tax=Trichoderma harzianum CBS 226.95 TaxID=983964 RepID=A0A2T4AHG3_TRIHA|nr:hypothetical protein M431DRAFT_379789 [Trichoderma harzianum CBS 226.95]PTB56506.1 hypothetical protein M431DRAFT_379789 [Trichoderma harzianum CBS 226.95]